MDIAKLIIALLAIVGLLLVALAVMRLRKRRLFAASRAATGGCLCLALAALTVAVALNLYTYSRLTWEQPVAQLHFEQIGPQRYRVQVDSSGNAMQSYVLSGNQWQLDARVIKWQSWANLFGFNAVYRLDRISGRYASIDVTRSRPETAYDLSPTQGLDVGLAATWLPAWLNPLDTRFGSAAYLPMADGAQFSVSLSQSGLVARPENEAARTAVAQW